MLECGQDLDDIEIRCRLSAVKTLRVGWLVDFYNYMKTEEGKQIIMNGWRGSVILDAIQLDSQILPTILLICISVPLTRLVILA